MEIIDHVARVEKLRQLAYDAYRNISFDPEKRQASIIQEYTAHLGEHISELQTAGVSVENINLFVEGYLKRLQTWLSAKSRCFSPMITGGSNFNTRAHAKANDSEHKRCEEFISWIPYAKNKAIKHAKPKPEVILPEGKPERLELTFDGGRIEYAYIDNRMNIYHDSRLEPDRFKEFRSNGFLWSRKFECFTRQLTMNAVLSTGRLFPGMRETLPRV